jgi:hypothetical protein
VKPGIVCLFPQKTVWALQFSRTTHIEIFFVRVHVGGSEDVYDLFWGEGVLQSLPSGGSALLDVFLAYLERPISPTIEVGTAIAAGVCEANGIALKSRAFVREIQIRRRVRHHVSYLNPGRGQVLCLSDDRIALHGLTAAGVPGKDDLLQVREDQTVTQETQCPLDLASCQLTSEASAAQAVRASLISITPC